MKTYHIGLVDAARTPFGYGKTPGLAEFHACRNIDYLPPYILEYLGERETTKTALRQRMALNAAAVLADLNTRYPNRNFTKVKVV